jgi:hypothetical protein
MKAGLKTYEAFKQVISEVGNIRLAWFTTFNLNMDFFEKFVLSALAKMDPMELRSIKDYEALNERLLNSEDQGVDIKVFHDFRALNINVKKTSVPCIGVNPAELGDDFKYGVFHPKVILLVNEENEAWLITGSQNLTMAAWAKNVEAIAIRKLNDKENAQLVVDFFSAIVSSDEDQASLQSLNRIWQKSLKGKADWFFTHTLSGRGLLDRIGGVSVSSLHVWSPYFSDGMVSLIQEHFSWTKDLCIIPDVTAAGSIRMTDEEIKSVLVHNRIQFLNDTNAKTFETLVHAKVWVTQHHLAIGSWNFTKAGLHLIPQASNIEAGIVQEWSKTDYNAFLKSADLNEMALPEGMIKEELEDERSDLLFNWRISCQLYADWSIYQYRLECSEDLFEREYFFDLPGRATRVSSIKFRDNSIGFFDEHKRLLKDRLFSVYDQAEGGEKVFMGVMVELNPIHRPAVGFESIDDLLRAWSDRLPEKKTQFHQVNYTLDTETGEELTEQMTQALRGDYSNAWFTMFLAFEQMKIRLSEVSKDAQELNMLGYRIPGSITQISEHLHVVRNKWESDSVEMSEVFIWFIINEGNQVIEQFNLIKPNDSPFIEKVKNIDLQFKDVDKSKMKKWLEYIQLQCKY